MQKEQTTFLKLNLILMENNIHEEIEQLRMDRYIQDLDHIYMHLNQIVREELDTSLEEFLIEYYKLKKIASTV